MRDAIVVPEPRHRRARRARVTLLIPAKNEESGIRETLLSLPLGRLRALGYEPEALVVDGKSTDRTREIANAVGARVLLQVGMGKGNAVRGALRAVDSDYVAMLDADDTYPAARIPDLLRWLDRGYDVVMGSRLRGAADPGAMRALNRVGNAGLSALASFLFGRRCTDVCTGLWAFRRDAVSALRLTSQSFEIEAELYAAVMKAGLLVTEVPITYRARRGETKLSRVGDGLRIGATLVRERLRGGFRPVVVAERPSEPGIAAAPRARAPE